jgi:hypothetical protein
MIENTKNQNYSGVLCRSCRQPIPLPTVVTAPSRDEGPDNRAGDETRVFNLRCRACDKERPYRRSDIAVFEGTPKLRAMPRPNGAVRAKKLSRAVGA